MGQLKNLFYFAYGVIPSMDRFPGVQSPEGIPTGDSFGKWKCSWTGVMNRRNPGLTVTSVPSARSHTLSLFLIRQTNLPLHIPALSGQTKIILLKVFFPLNPKSRLPASQSHIHPSIPYFPQKKIHFGLLFAINHYLYAIFITSLHLLVSIEWLEEGILNSTEEWISVC